MRGGHWLRTAWHAAIVAGSVQSVREPVRIEALPTSVRQVSAGRAHAAACTVAPDIVVSTDPVAMQLGLPDSIPDQYPALHGKDAVTLRHRLRLLYHFSELMYQSWRLLPVSFNSADRGAFQAGVRGARARPPAGSPRPPWPAVAFRRASSRPFSRCLLFLPPRASRLLLPIAGYGRRTTARALPSDQAVSRLHAFRRLSAFS